MSDLFHDGVPSAYVDAVASVMRHANWHTYQVLTKRSQRLRKHLNSTLTIEADADHIWWGVSVENRRFGIPRIADLQAADVGTRFLSIEPLLEDVGTLDLAGIGWVIVGGESGHGARPMRREWVESIRLQCEAAHVPFFFKQWGGVQKARAGRMLNGRTYDAVPMRSARPMPQLAERRLLMSELKPLVLSWQPATVDA
jgi:protein gp37